MPLSPAHFRHLRGSGILPSMIEEIMKCYSVPPAEINRLSPALKTVRVPSGLPIPWRERLLPLPSIPAAGLNEVLATVRKQRPPLYSPVRQSDPVESLHRDRHHRGREKGGLPDSEWDPNDRRSAASGAGEMAPAIFIRNSMRLLRRSIRVDRFRLQRLAERKRGDRTRAVCVG